MPANRGLNDFNSFKIPLFNKNLYYVDVTLYFCYIYKLSNLFADNVTRNS